MTRKQKKTLIRIIIAAVFFFLGLFLPLGEAFKLIPFLLSYFIIGYDILIKSVKGIINLQPFDENFLMAVATIGAFALGEYHEGVAVMLLYQIGELFQSYAIGKSRKSISSLMDIRPDFARVEENGEYKIISPNDVKVGDIITVFAGERVALDGVILSGSADVDTRALTGESAPQALSENDCVFGGSVNLNGVLKIKTTAEFKDSSVSKILSLVENAASKKSKSENFISRFSRIYTPAVCISALVIGGVLPLIISIFTKTPPDFVPFIYRALTFLVISCPCAFVISIPLSFFAGIGSAGKEGILIKGANHLEALSKVKHLVFDKTGTVTKGVFRVVGVHHSALSEAQLLNLAALAESGSNHPIATCIKEAAEAGLDTSRVSDIKELGGLGVSCLIDGEQVLVGNSKLMHERNIDFQECTHFGTIVHVAKNGDYLGHILIRDTVKKEAAEALSRLYRLGIKTTTMLTGDRESAAKDIAEKLSFDRAVYGLLPHQKVETVEKLLNETKDKEKLAFVGDGINDAPVLTRSDVGIAMGALGSDAAIEAADVVLMDDNLLKLPKAIRISKKCMGIVMQNTCFAIIIKFLFLVLSTLGYSEMWFAVFADVGVMILAVLNALRALHIKSEE